MKQTLVLAVKLMVSIQPSIDYIIHEQLLLEVGAQKIEVPQSATDTNSEASLIVTYTGSTDVVVEGTLDIPGASEEVVETENQLLPTPESYQQPKNGAPAYRQQLLLM